MTRGHTNVGEHVFISPTRSSRLIDLRLQLRRHCVGLVVLFLDLLQRGLFGLLRITGEAPVPVAAANLLDPDHVLIRKGLQVVLDLHAAD
jgi:hypothetical protein